MFGGRKKTQLWGYCLLHLLRHPYKILEQPHKSTSTSVYSCCWQGNVAETCSTHSDSSHRASISAVLSLPPVKYCQECRSCSWPFLQAWVAGSPIQSAHALLKKATGPVLYFGSSAICHLKSEHCSLITQPLWVCSLTHSWRSFQYIFDEQSR